LCRSHEIDKTYYGNCGTESGQMDRQWFITALERAAVSQAELARHLRLAPSAVSRMVKGERQMKLQEAVQIASFLGVSQDEVLRRAGATASADAPVRIEPIPIRSAKSVAGSDETSLEDEPIGYTSRPGNLNGVRGAYAIYMIGNRMEPRYEPGWLLHVNPFKPATRGRDVVVFKADQAVLIKQFVRWDADALVLRQLNPPEELRVPREEVVECHLVVGVDQEG
jgi:transcriptional regulator with XRE-family HTH domain